MEPLRKGTSAMLGNLCCLLDEIIRYWHQLSSCSNFASTITLDWLSLAGLKVTVSRYSTNDGSLFSANLWVAFSDLQPSVFHLMEALEVALPLVPHLFLAECERKRLLLGDEILEH